MLLACRVAVTAALVDGALLLSARRGASLPCWQPKLPLPASRIFPAPWSSCSVVSLVHSHGALGRSSAPPAPLRCLLPLSSSSPCTDSLHRELQFGFLLPWCLSRARPGLCASLLATPSVWRPASLLPYARRSPSPCVLDLLCSPALRPAPSSQVPMPRAVLLGRHGARPYARAPRSPCFLAAFCWSALGLRPSSLGAFQPRAREPCLWPSRWSPPHLLGLARNSRSHEVAELQGTDSSLCRA